MPSLREEIERRLTDGSGAALARRGGAPTTDGFLRGVGACAPYLGKLLDRHGEGLLAADPGEAWADMLREVRAAPPDQTRTVLRRAKRRAALHLALLDLCGARDMTAVTAALSDFADACVASALRGAWSEVGQDPDPAACGLGVLALGKLGTRTLNYSSDIDLVLAYDPERLPEAGRAGPRGLAAKVTQRLLSILSDQTAEGYVFRTDLRLRPDPSSSAPAVSLAQAERYYETYGQNWERAAYIKARGCAGDEAVTNGYLDIVRPFVWRRTLDFAALADIRAVKAQIHAKVGSPEIGSAGGDVKLGPGGIREVEFFAETQQLILGGRDPSLRVPGTLDALDALAEAGHVTRGDADALQTAYRFLRNTEHRIQMRHDEASQTVPEAAGARADLAAMMNMDLAGFDAALTSALHAVHDRYAELFEPSVPDAPPPGSLVFTGVDDDPRTVATLTRMGFTRPSEAIALIRRWHQGGLVATKSVRARELLTGLVPRILTACAEGDDADAALTATGRFLSQLPQGLSLFSLFTAHPEVLDDVVALCAASPDLSQRLARRPALVDGLLTEDGEAPPAVPSGLGLEQTMDEVRWQVGGERVRLAARLALGRGDPYEAGAAFTDLADEAIGALFAAAAREGSRRGEAPGPPLAVLGFGRLGTRSLTAHSDLDLVFVYDGAPDGAASGVLRRVRRLVAALSAPTAAGVLYEVDMRLRPSGGAGPAAVTLEALDRYYAQTAQGWEAMALTKARVLWAEEAVGDEVEACVAGRLRSGWVAERIGADARAMRARLAAEHPPRGPLDVKRMSGGGTDLDFAVQALSLSGPHEARPPLSTPGALVWHAEHGRITSEEAEAMLRIHRLFEGVVQYARATQGSAPLPVPRGVHAARLAQLTGADEEIEEALETASVAVRRFFGRVTGAE